MNRTPSSEGRDLRVATFNVRAAIGPGPFPELWWRHCDPARLERIAAVIRALDADVVALQEVAILALDGELVDQAAELSRMTGMAHRYGAVRSWRAEEPDGVHGAGLFGNALLAHDPLVDARVVALPRADDAALIEAEDADHRWAGVTWGEAPPSTREPRCALLATVDGLRIASTHFSHVGSGERGLQAGALANAGADLVLGDLNSPLDQPAMAPFSDWTDAFAAVGIPLGDARRRSTDDGWPIDQVLLRPRLGWRVAGCEVIRSAGEASDHYPVVAYLRHSSHAATDATGYPPAQ